MSARVIRCDRASCVIDVVDAPEAPTPGRAAAVRHPQGYLEVDAYLARDGLLRYSDGRDSWIEYRPRAELERAADTWAHTPVTDAHPSRMVTADTWSQVARGVVLDGLSVEGPSPDGVSYLRGRLLITDADLVRKIEAGQREVSIGFTTAVIPAADGLAPDGTRCDAVQTQLTGNHLASVARGRAGPAVRVLMDGAQIPVYDGQDHAAPSEYPHVKTKNEPNPKPAARASEDEIGAPVTTIELVGPDGETVTVPSWVAGELQRLRKQLSGEDLGPAPGAAEPEKPAPAAPKPDELNAPAPGAPPDEEDEMKMTPDAVAALVRKRGRLVRLATTAGLDAAKIDAATDVDLARAFVAARAPYLKERADAAEGEVLDVLVDAAAATPEPRADANPFECGVGTTRLDALSKDPHAATISAFMERQGYTH